MDFKNTLAFAQQLDEDDPLKDFRKKFYIPEKNGKPVIYFCGNSLGLQPQSTQHYLAQVLEAWQHLAVEGHFSGANPWSTFHKKLREPIAKLIGALPIEVISMNALTVNLHLLLVSFYRPTPQRYKILVEHKPFPSDRYALSSHIRWHGLSEEDCFIELRPREHEHSLRTEDILQAIEQHKEELALVLFGGINYLSGQLFELEKITQAAHQAGALMGLDLAHAIGNVPLQLHQWQVDFATWCTYKYLNSGPGGIAGIFIHEKFAHQSQLPRFAGWYGHNEERRFLMEETFQPIPGADGWQLSNGPALLFASLKASLDIFEEAGIENLRKKSIQLTGYLEFLLAGLNKKAGKERINVITPTNSEERGCQLSLEITGRGKEYFQKLTKAGVILDWREPNILRVAPVPLYNTFEEVYNFYKILEEI
ncbi:kynureninase [Rapidithrix thailandica]|uniref:Kynureninase n=1 Tax=Rapidithrix thailandica TaxID=413964 RepID=A0AAW9S754_9BACT